MWLFGFSKYKLLIFQYIFCINSLRILRCRLAVFHLYSHGITFCPGHDMGAQVLSLLQYGKALLTSQSIQHNVHLGGT